MKKPKTPPVKAHLGVAVLPLTGQGPMTPFGTRIECWGGAMAVDHALQLWDVGDQLTCCVAQVDDLSASDRQVIAEYQIALWTAFRDWREA